MVNLNFVLNNLRPNDCILSEAGATFDKLLYNLSLPTNFPYGECTGNGQQSWILFRNMFPEPLCGDIIDGISA